VRLARSTGGSRRLDLPREMAALARVRRFVEDLGRAGGISEDRIYDLRVAVSEACANAIEHSPGEACLEVVGYRDNGFLLIEVKDEGSFKMRPDGGSGHRGMGLGLMIALTDRASFDRTEGGGLHVTLGIRL
jgi:serine/threonine-protein kinase RsbW